MPDDYSFKTIAIVHCEDKREDLGALHREEKAKRKAVIEILPEFSEGLMDVETFSHLYIIWVFHRSEGFHLISHPPWDDRRPHGVFATRSPHRPNPVGQTIVKLEKREGDKLHVTGADMIDCTPVIDIKPYTSSDIKQDYDEGWLKEVRKRRGD